MIDDIAWKAAEAEWGHSLNVHAVHVEGPDVEGYLGALQGAALGTVCQFKPDWEEIRAQVALAAYRLPARQIASPERIRAYLEGAARAFFVEQATRRGMPEEVARSSAMAVIHVGGLKSGRVLTSS